MAQRALYARHFLHLAAGNAADILNAGLRGVMGVGWNRHTGRNRVIRASGFLRPLLGAKHAISLFAAFIILLNAAVPYWHAAQRVQAWAAALSQPAAEHLPAMAGGVECPLHSAHAAHKQGSGEAPPRLKPCPLCQALQLFSPGVAQPSFAYLPCAQPSVAAFTAHRIELALSHEIPEQGRPRAPPLA